MALVSQPGHLWEKDALLKTLWPDSFVEESNLADNVFRLRKALGDGDNGQKFIETVPKRGYRFIALVTTTAAGPSNLDPQRQGTERARATSGTRRGIGFTFGALMAVTLIGGIIWRNARSSATADAVLAAKGNFYLSRWSEGDIRKAVDLFSCHRIESQLHRGLRRIGCVGTSCQTCTFHRVKRCPNTKQPS